MNYFNLRAALVGCATVVAAALAVVACGGGSGAAPPTTAPSPSSPPSPPSPPPVSPPSPPSPGTATTWEWILQATGLPATPPQVTYLDVDGFDTPSSYVAAAKARGDKTICYISIGTAENFRPDFAQFQTIPGAIGKQFPGFPGDFYLNINLYQQFLPVMDARLRMCQSKGFELVEFDVMDSFQDGASVTGFTISQATATAYITEMVKRTNGYGMQAVQKNTDNLTATFQPLFGALITEECVRLKFCGSAAPYVQARKPVLNAEYPSEWASGAFVKTNVCNTSAAAGVTTIITVLDLDRPSDRC